MEVFCKKGSAKYLMIQKQLLISVLQKSYLRSSRSQMFFEIMFLKISQYSHENTCAGVSL